MCHYVEGGSGWRVGGLSPKLGVGDFIPEGFVCATMVCYVQIYNQSLRITYNKRKTFWDTETTCHPLPIICERERERERKRERRREGGGRRVNGVQEIQKIYSYMYTSIFQ